MGFPAMSHQTRLLIRGGFFFTGWLMACLASAAPIMDFVPPPAGSYRLERIQPASEGAVLDADGRRRRLSEFTQGRVTLLAFMYSSCADPNGCPYALTVMHMVKSELEKLPETRGRVRFVSLSFDPVRDTPQTLALYGRDHSGAGQHLAWDFLTTRSRRELLPILNGFGQDVGVDIDKATGKPVGTYSHVLKVFLIDRQRTVREIYTTDYLLPAMVLNDIKTLLIEEGVRLK
ncbi:MAG: SCO1/SenC family protein/methylamine utilization protein MauG [Rhodocyclaceae bacterium]|nr:MAG: SCO1/SenC family protein/methylamine utilization protein MauG [Rhodocyclaceae bacterium]TND01263.1 MAG: SCO1/SenC family protein/methylamine utilization protein MauG [Rhodocyclaceae bacterium]